jgi:FMNH2-dependent dimethyl sulfone monooxygenase
LPVFGGWLRNVDDEGMAASWAYARDLATRAEEIGFDLTLIAELNLNDIKGAEAPSLHAWSTAAALAAVTHRLELMVAVRPSFHPPALFAKMAANVDRISEGRLSLNVVSAWWADEARRFGMDFDDHGDRYGRTEEWIEVVNGLWSEPVFSHEGRYYRVDEGIVSPGPLQRPRPILYAGGESERGRETIARTCDAWLTHGDPPETLAPKVAAMARRREALGLPPMRYGVAGYAVVRSTEAEARAEVARITDVKASARGYRNYRDFVEHSKLQSSVSIEDYSVSNRGLRTGLVGTPEQVAGRLRELEALGMDLVLLQCSPQREEMERFAEEVIPLVRSG